MLQAMPARSSKVCCGSVSRMCSASTGACAPIGAIDKMTVISTDGASSLTKSVASNVAQGLQLGSDLTGVDLGALITRIAGVGNGNQSEPVGVGNGNQSEPTGVGVADPKAVEAPKVIDEQ